MSGIIRIQGREILDSRGWPTVEVDVLLEDGSMGRAAVPSGASTGSMEAIELRDQDNGRYKGKGVLAAVSAVNGEISEAITGMDAREQLLIDEALITLDGTENKARLGANAVLAVSLAIAKAAAASSGVSLFRYVGGMYGHKLPVPMMNILNGGMHADNSIDIQEFMIMPVKAGSINEAVRIGSEIFHSLKQLLKQAGYNTNIGDEGGFAPEMKNSREALDFLIRAIETAGYKAGNQVYIALDSAASELYKEGKYHLTGENMVLDKDQFIKYYSTLLNDYPIISLEDPMAEDDHAGWSLITQELGNKVQLVGDDLFATNPRILAAGIKKKLANAVLIKPNQIGTLSETMHTINLAHNSGYKTVISHRSGETEDTTIAHLAVAVNAGQIKTGSLSRSERLAKYNELIRIEDELALSGNYYGENVLTKFS